MKPDIGLIALERILLLLVSKSAGLCDSTLIVNHFFVDCVCTAAKIESLNTVCFLFSFFLLKNSNSPQPTEPTFGFYRSLTKTLAKFYETVQLTRDRAPLVKDYISDK